MSDNTVLDTVVLRTIRGLGYTRLNDEEKSLIENLRWTRCGFHDHPDTHSTDIRTLIPR
ncbi:hypothetical protein [Pseudomonas sp. M47T1]|uniref:hypothetical protein n=1 Tax=Pseudomonas sp. M47T1 TaxID=1179778 RepID=UPI0012FC192E|nr:hypothetical protein [Pseudomonas sp. M47T1]